MVDHSDEEETRIFRSLLSHLLTSPIPIVPTTRVEKPAKPTLVVPETTSFSSDEASPMKISAVDDARSLPGTLESDEVMGDAQSAVDAPPPPARSVVSMEEDPVEHEINDGGKAPSAERYKERTAVFEQLMSFVNEDAKQPDSDLLRMFNVDQGNF